MKPKLIHNWPKVKDEHDEVSNIIKDVIKEYKFIKHSSRKLLKDASYAKEFGSNSNNNFTSEFNLKAFENFD